MGWHIFSVQLPRAAEGEITEKKRTQEQKFELINKLIDTKITPKLYMCLFGLIDLNVKIIYVWWP